MARARNPELPLATKSESCFITFGLAHRVFWYLRWEINGRFCCLNWSDYVRNGKVIYNRVYTRIQNLNLEAKIRLDIRIGWVRLIIVWYTDSAH